MYMYIYSKVLYKWLFMLASNLCELTQFGIKKALANYDYDACCQACSHRYLDRIGRGYHIQHQREGKEKKEEEEGLTLYSW